MMLMRAVIVLYTLATAIVLVLHALVTLATDRERRASAVPAPPSGGRAAAPTAMLWACSFRRRSRRRMPRTCPA